METREVLTKFDRNGDGEVDESELEGVVDVLVKEQFKGRLFLCGIGMILFSLVLLLASSFGLTWAVVMAHKDTLIRGQVMIVKGSNSALQLPNSDYTVNAGGSLTGRDATVLATAPSYYSRQLTANMTVRLLNKLARVSVTSSTGAQVGFRVTGFMINSSAPEPQLRITTPSGLLVVDGEQLSDFTAATSLMDPDGLEGQAVTGIFSG